MFLSLEETAGWTQHSRSAAGLRGRAVVGRGGEQAVGASRASASRKDERPGAACPTAMHSGVPASWKHVSL